VEGEPTEESDVEGEPRFVIPEKGDNAKARECMRDLDDLLKLLR
jgi:hypothetical protein